MFALNQEKKFPPFLRFERGAEDPERKPARFPVLVEGSIEEKKRNKT